MVGVSTTRPEGEVLPERTVENRSEHAKRLHRPHDGRADPVPACEERHRTEAEFRWANTEQMLGFRRLCKNPGCFGDDGDGQNDDRDTNEGEWPDQEICPVCGGQEHRRTTTSSGATIIGPCGCEVSPRPIPDGGLRYSTTDNVDVTDHARSRWSERAGVSRDVDDAWREAIPVHHPRAPLHSGLYTRYHPEGDVVLLAHRTTVLTVLDRHQPPQGRPGADPGGAV